MAAELVVESVTAGLCTHVPALDPATGAPVLLITYRGRVTVRRQSSGFAVLSPERTFAVSFFVPDGPPRAAGTHPPQALHCRVTPGFVSGAANSSATGVRHAAVDLADDPRGGTDRWLRVRFEMPQSTEHAELDYEVVVAEVSGVPGLSGVSEVSTAG